MFGAEVGVGLTAGKRSRGGDGTASHGRIARLALAHEALRRSLREWRSRTTRPSLARSEPTEHAHVAGNSSARNVAPRALAIAAPSTTSLRVERDSHSHAPMTAASGMKSIGMSTSKCPITGT